ncbi:MAG: hypothetical protein Q4B62_08945 [Clostridiaceae bacterium]|nr:hypothetical protein [Clostridiaceae bacterium]
MKDLQELKQEIVDKRKALSSINKELIALKNKISESRELLDKSDYKRFKNVEYLAVGLELPYSWEEIHKESQKLRDIINENEAKIQPLTEHYNSLQDELQAAISSYRSALDSLNNDSEEKITEESPDEGEVWEFERANN